MSIAMTSSIRLPMDLRHTLESAAAQLQRGKNWIIVQALREYLERLGHARLAHEAKRQLHVAAAQSDHDEIALWESLGEESWPQERAVEPAQPAANPDAQ